MENTSREIGLEKCENEKGSEPPSRFAFPKRILQPNSHPVLQFACLVRCSDGFVGTKRVLGLGLVALSVFVRRHLDLELILLPIISPHLGCSNFIPPPQIGKGEEK